MRADPTGLTPERALVFEVASSISDFTRAARDVGLEVLAEVDFPIEGTEIPEGFAPAEEGAALTATLYATMPTQETFDRLFTLWNAYDRDDPRPDGAAPWWSMFDRLLRLRVWGPEDRLPPWSRNALRRRLEEEPDRDVRVEIEFWPVGDQSKRDRWRDELVGTVRALDGRVLDAAQISGRGFAYDALLIVLPATAVEQMLENAAAAGSVATVDGVQFVLPQTLATVPSDAEATAATVDQQQPFDLTAPFRAALFDGVPVAAHPDIDGGLRIDDPHKLVPISVAEQRYHATSMASLILRGDLIADGAPVPGARLLCVPILVDGSDWQGRPTAEAPSDRLFIDVVHEALAHLFIGDPAAGEDVFVVNFSIGLPEHRFAGRMSSLGRLLDWWAATHGVLFVVSAGNISDPLLVPGVTSTALEDMDDAERTSAIEDAFGTQLAERTLLAPAEAVNTLTVGALSLDEVSDEPTAVNGIIKLGHKFNDAVSLASAIGLGPSRTVKPDVLAPGGCQEWRLIPSGNDSRLRPATGQRTGLNVAAAEPTRRTRQRARGTSCAAAMVTRRILFASEALTADGGPFDGVVLSRRDRALLTRALCVHSAAWDRHAQDFLGGTLHAIGARRHGQAKEQTAKRFGYGRISADRMEASPSDGVTLVGLGTVRRDGAVVFDVPLPPSLSGQQSERSLDVTIAWFSPVDPTRKLYRLAALEAKADSSTDTGGSSVDDGWGLLLKTFGESADANLTGRGTVWSRRLKAARQAAPAYSTGTVLPVRVQCRETAKRVLDPNEDIPFALAITLIVEVQTQFDILGEVREQLVVRTATSST